MIRRDPGQTVALTVIPFGLAIAQLVNSLVTELSFFISVPFAVVLIGIAVGLDQYHFARFRRLELEREYFGYR